MSRGGKFIFFMVSECVIRERVAKNVKKKQQLCLEDMLVYYLPTDTKLFRLSFCWNFFESSRNWGRKYKGQRWSLPDQILIGCFTIQQFVSAGVSHLTKSLNLISLYARLILRKLCLLWIDDNVKTTKERPLEDNNHCRDLTAWRYDKL